MAAITLGGLGPVKIFANFSGALMLVPIVFVVISWFKMIREDNVLGTCRTPVRAKLRDEAVSEADLPGAVPVPVPVRD